MVPQGMTKPTIARGLQPQLHHVEASELSVRPTLTHDGGWECLLLIPLGGASEEPTDRSDRVPTAVSSTTPSQGRGHI